MSELNLLGFDHAGTCYNLAYRELQKASPDIITLEMSLFEYSGKVYLGNLFDYHLDYLDFIEEFLKENTWGGEYQAACVFARRHDLPLYLIDKTNIAPKKVIKYDLMKVRKPYRLFKYRESSDKFFREHNLLSRNLFMANVLDLLARPKTKISHIGGAWHIDKNNPEGVAPIQDLVKNFDSVIPILFYSKKE